MKTPGDTDLQSIAIDQTDSTIDYADAFETAAELGADPASYAPETDTIEIDDDFVIRWNHKGQQESKQEVLPMIFRGLSAAPSPPRSC